MGTHLGAMKTAALRCGMPVERYIKLRSSGRKRCTACKQWKFRGAYYGHKNSPDGLSARCKVCSLERNKNRSYPLCVHCGVKSGGRPQKLCWRCYYTPGVKERYPQSKYSPGRREGEMTEAELNKVIEQQKANLPNWWPKHGQADMEDDER